MATKKTAAKKKAAPKKTAAKKRPVTADVEVAPAYTAWSPAAMPTGGKSNSTEMLNDHPTEHNHTAAAVSDIVDRFADLRLDVRGVWGSAVAGDLQVDGQMSVYNGTASTPTYSFWNDRTVGLYLAGVGKAGFAGDLQVNGQVSLAGGVAGNLQVDGQVYLAGGTVTGDLQVGGQMSVYNGTASTPTYSFWNDRTVGLYLAGVGKAGFAGDLQVNGTISDVNGPVRSFAIANGIDTADLLDRAETATMPVLDGEVVATGDTDVESITVNEVVTALLAKVKQLTARIEALEAAG